MYVATTTSSTSTYFIQSHRYRTMKQQHQQQSSDIPPPGTAIIVFRDRISPVTCMEWNVVHELIIESEILYLCSSLVSITLLQKRLTQTVVVFVLTMLIRVPDACGEKYRYIFGLSCCLALIWSAYIHTGRWYAGVHAYGCRDWYLGR